MLYNVEYFFGIFFFFFNLCSIGNCNCIIMDEVYMVKVFIKIFNLYL